MIEREEIERVADDLSVNPTDVERDYVNGWLLSGVAGSPLRDTLVLKGGNALRKGYFENTRYSKDLDFSTPGAIDQDHLRSELETICGAVSEQTGVQFLNDRLVVHEKRRVSKDLEVLEVRAYFLDFYGERQDVPLRVYMDVTQYDRLLLPATERPIIHPYSDAALCVGTIRCVALEEILASKLKCLLQRRHVADLFDYLRWVFFEDVAIDRGQLLRVFLQKTIYDRAPGAAFELLASLPFAALQEFWDRYITCPASCRIGFDEGVQRFRTHLVDLFGERRHDHGYRLEFVSAAQREPIMSAGRNRHLMRLVYDGAERIVEPYSIRYKERQDGGGGEYFCAFNRSGGSSPPGIRTFVPSKIEALEELQDAFEPQYEIEVSKAGDEPDDVHFHGSGRPRRFIPAFGATRSPRPRARSISSGPKHRIRCPQCRRLFTRKSYDLKLEPHANPRGGKCYGAWGSHEGFR